MTEIPELTEEDLVPRVLAVISPLVVNEGGVGTITISLLIVTDTDNTASELTYSVISSPAHGTLFLAGSPTTSFSQANVNTGIVTYQHDGSAATSDGFQFTVTDGAGG